MRTLQLTSVTHKEAGIFVSLCPEVDVASQGTTLEQAQANLREAVELFLETADTEELAARLSGQPVVAGMEIAVG